jgi:hypothetical protein
MLQLAATHAATMNNREAAIRCGNTESRQADWPCLPPLYVALGLLAVVGCSQAARSGTAEFEALSTSAAQALWPPPVSGRPRSSSALSRGSAAAPF